MIFEKCNFSGFIFFQTNKTNRYYYIKIIHTHSASTIIIQGRPNSSLIYTYEMFLNWWFYRRFYINIEIDYLPLFCVCKLIYLHKSLNQIHTHTHLNLNLCQIGFASSFELVYILNEFHNSCINHLSSHISCSRRKHWESDCAIKCS